MATFDEANKISDCIRCFFVVEINGDISGAGFHKGLHE